MMEQGIIMYTILLMCILQDSAISCNIRLARNGLIEHWARISGGAHHCGMTIDEAKQPDSARA